MLIFHKDMSAWAIVSVWRRKFLSHTLLLSTGRSWKLILIVIIFQFDPEFHIISTFISNQSDNKSVLNNFNFKASLKKKFH